jgi:long-chain fatty acid transport protein
LTRCFRKGWHVSAGYAYDQNSVPDTYYNPYAADLDRHFFSIGVGRCGKRFDFDITYQFGYGPARTVTGSQPPLLSERITTASADGTYTFISNAIMVSAGMHF